MILFIKHVDIEGPETLGMFFVNKGHVLKVINLHDGDKLPDNLNGVEAVIPLGGPMNVYEEAKYPFLKEEDAFLKKALMQKVPVLGICLGAQLLAKASGGKVVRSPGREIGWFTVNITTAGLKDPLFKGFPNPLEVYQWHGDMCVPPEGAELLASSPKCPVQAFRVGTNAYGLQFHAEITDKSIQDWTHEIAPDYRAKVREGMLRHYADVKQDFHRHGAIMCENFLKIITV
ncbi:MAG: type 1 glutamine amidotransferase [Candidatus Omnitrophica bacterium]|nr:type 1 glutamine amidotransferase [Candidatus Omnitrophota bacterium]